MATFKHKMLVWFWDLINAAITGLATAVASVFTGEVVFNSVDFSPRQVYAIAISGAIAGAVQYVRQRRLPEIDEVTTTVSVTSTVTGKEDKIEKIDKIR